MTQEKKEKETTSVPMTRQAELLPRWGEMERWFDRMFEDFWRRPLPSRWRPERWWPGEVSMPALDVFEEKDDVVVKAELPGLGKEDLQVQITGNTLTLKGEKKKKEEVKQEEYYYCERSHGSFTRNIELPCEVKSDQTKASFKDGVLEVRLPKTEESKKKSIAVKID